MIDRLQKNINEAIALKQGLLSNDKLLSDVVRISETFVKSFRSDGKILFCGNGGSAADAQHLAAEFTGRYYKDRPALYAEALHVNSSYLTAVSNDYSYEHAYARLVDGIGREGDILVCLSTSGNSENILKAIDAAKLKNLIIVGFTGESGGKMKDLCDIIIRVPSKDTPRIQEAHMLLGHTICEIVEEKMFGK